MSKFLCFIYDAMADFEMTMATTVTGMWLERELITIAYEDKVVTSKPGVRYMPHMTVKEALALEDVDGIMIPGGWSDEFRPELNELLNKLNDEGKLIAAICAGPQYLAKAGILNDKKYTTTMSPEALEQMGKEDFFPREGFVKEKVVRDKNIITSVGVAFVDFAMEIADWFKMFEEKNVDVTKEQLANIYKGL